MFCKKCGNELKEGENFCSKCGKSISDKNNTNKVIISIVSVILIGVVILCGCFFINKNEENSEIEIQKGNKAETSKKEEIIKTLEAKNKNSSAINDMDLGLSSVKIDNTTANLTEEQKIVIQYFDNDYVSANDYEFLMRYPQIYENSQIKTHGKVSKIIKSDDKEYELVVWIGHSKQYYEYWENYRSGVDTTYNEYVQNNINNYIVIKGKQTETRLIEGDWITIYGRYSSIDSYTIDGKSYTIPTINVYETVHDDFNRVDGIPQRFDYKFLRKVAKAIFNDKITLREATEEEAVITSSAFMNNPAYVCELDNQSNAKFSKYFFNCNSGSISDIRNDDYVFSKIDNAGINRYIEFAPDFEHFFLFIYDRNSRILTVEYYDKEFERIWYREFEETELATYDYTENNIYLVANGYLYTINTKTGEDTYNKKYVGKKIDIRKLKDSLLLFSYGETETVMKTDLKGNILWTANVKNQGEGFEVQIKENTLITTGYDNGKFYSIIDLKTGEIKLNAKSLSNENDGL